MDFLTTLLCLVLAWIFIHSFISINRGLKSNLPPGPIPFPIVGNLFKLGNKPHKSLAHLANTHGPIMTLKLGSLTTVVISSATTAKLVLQTHDTSFSSRTVPHSIRALNHDQVSMAWIPVSPRWQNLRKTSNSHVFMTSQRQERIRCFKMEELISFVRESSKAGVAVDIGKAAFGTSLNLLSNTIFSIDLVDIGSDYTQEFKELVWNIMEEQGRPNLADYFPVLKGVDPQGIQRRLACCMGKMLKVFDGMIETRLLERKTRDSVPPNDVLDMLLNTEESSNEIDRKDVKHLLLDLFVAGTDTTSNTLEWAMAELLRNPTIGKIARQEMEQNIDKGQALVQESDIFARLPYLQAILKETFRLHPPTPLLLPRKAERDVTLCGFTVPKGAQVLVNAWAIGRDPSTWADPGSFRPERFLGSEINVKGQHFELIPFGAGRRVCPAVTMANRMVHLMLASLIRSFEWKLEEGVIAEDMDMEDEFGITVRKAERLRAIPMYIN